MGYERFFAPEILFQPNIHGIEIAGIHKSLYNSIMKCEVDIRRNLFSSIYLVGGTCSMPGMLERLYREIFKMTPPSINVKIISTDNIKIASWLGGSLIASIPAYENMWIPRKDYLEYGKAVIFRK